MGIDQQAYDIAMKELANGKFSWQAYLVMATAESRLDVVPDSTVDESIDSFRSRFIEYANSKGTPEAMDALKRCLSVAVATMSELLVGCDGSERDEVANACRKIGDMA